MQFGHRIRPAWRLESPRRPPFPIRSEPAGFAFQVNGNNLGEDRSVAPVPVQGMLDVASRRVVMLVRIGPRIDAAPPGDRAVPQLKGADGAVTVPRRTPSRANRKTLRKVQPAL